MNAGENQELRADHAAAGAALAAARTAQNLSVAEVARQLKLSAGQIEALEAGEFERLPGPVFVRGFIRNYARLLKLDPDGILSSIKTSTVVDEPRDAFPSSQEIPFPSRTTRRWPKYAIASLLVVAALATYEFYWIEPVTVKGSTPPLLPTARVTAPPVQETVPAPVMTPAAPDATQNATPAEQGPAQPPRDTADAAPSGPSQFDQQSKPEEGELHLTFEQESWVTVRDRSGKTIFARLNPAGSEQRVRGKPPLTLIVGNARGVRLTYNERPVDLRPHINVEVARLAIE